MHFYILHAFFGFAIVKITGWPMLMIERNVSSDPTKIIQSFILMACMIVLVTTWIFVERAIKQKLLKK